MAVLDHFFAKYIFCGYDGGRLFLGVMSVTFLGPGIGFPKLRGVFQKGGGILCFGVFF